MEVSQLTSQENKHIQNKIPNYSISKKINRIHLGIIILIFILLGWNRGKIDLSISQFIVNNRSSLGIFIEDYGEFPGFAVVFIASFYGLKNIQTKERYYYIPTLLISMISFYSMFRWLGILAGIFVVLVYFKIEGNLTQSFSRVTNILFVLYVGILVQVIKLLWGRIRYRDLVEIGDFTPWYKINGINGNHSFPSGHTAMGIMVLPLSMLNQQLKYPLYVWAFIVGIGRVIIGAHYMSDILFSIFSGYYTFMHLKNQFAEQNIDT